MQSRRFFPRVTEIRHPAVGLLLILVLAAPLVALDGHEHRNLDNRNFGTPPQAGTKISQSKGLQDLKKEVPNAMTTYDPITGATRTVTNPTGYLTSEEVKNPDPLALSLSWINSNHGLLGLSSADVGEYEITDFTTSTPTGATRIYLRQLHQGLPVYNGQLQVNLNRSGKVVSVNNAFIPDLATTINTLTPTLDAGAAVGYAATNLDIKIRRVPQTLGAPQGVRQITSVDPGGISTESIEAGLMLIPVAKDDTRLVWNFQIYTLDRSHAFDFTVDAVSGQIWTRYDWASAAKYRAYKQPAETPNHVSPSPPADGRQLIVNPQNGAASPFGWHDTNGVAGPEFTIHRGNNVHAFEDSDSNGQPPSNEPDCGPSLDCDFPIDLTAQPSTYSDAAVTNLFYWNNIVHDIQHRYGFDEAAGNFQVNNYGRGGIGGDAVTAQAQFGNICNAFWFAAPEGSSPRMQMYVCNNSNPGRDGDLDNMVIVHEYGHGISTRLVGGPSNVSCLNNRQQAGEGLSDWWGLAYTATANQTGATPRGVGTWLFGQGAGGAGIRNQPYSTDPAVNTWTYESITGALIPHGVGAVWAQAAWEVYWALVGRHGFSSNLPNAAGSAGNQRMMLYVNEGLKNTICNPTFTDIRDGIIQAAVDNHGGFDVCTLWNAFAAFGLGDDAQSGGPNSTVPTNGFGVPSECQGPGDQPPTASFTFSCNGLNCTFDGRDSSDDNGITGYAWSYGDGTTGSGVITNHTYPSNGTYSVRLTVTDTIGQTGTQDRNVTVNQDDSPPTANFTFSCSGLTCSFNGSSSSDDNGITGYAWSFGDGTSGSGVTTSHTYASSGTYSARLTVTDTIGQTGSQTRSVTASCGDTTSPSSAVITSPDDGDFAFGTLPVTVTATDNVGVDKVQVRVDGAVKCTDTNGPPWSCNLNVDSFFSGLREITARAFDACGNSRTSAGIDVFFNSNPLPSLGAPSEGATVGGESVALSGWATDSDGVTSITVMVDGQAVPVTYGTPRPDVCAAVPVNDPNCPNVGWAGTLDATQLADGTHTYTMTVTDGDGKSTANWPNPPRTFQVFNPPNVDPCVPDANTLCLRGGRFEVKADFVDGGVTSAARASSHGTDQTGTFWFFNSSNLEIGVKVLGPASGHWWVFHGGLTSLEYTLTVRDTVTGSSKSYLKPLDSFCGDPDTQAFPDVGESFTIKSRPAGDLGELTFHPGNGVFFDAGVGIDGSCSPGPNHLCLQGSRFKVEVRRGGVAQPAVPMTADSGAFWFFSNQNLEVIAKVLDGTAINGKYWVFTAGLSDQAYEVVVTDTATGTSKTYPNALNNYCGVGDTIAF